MFCACTRSGSPHNVVHFLIITGNFRIVVRSIFAHAQISITTETLQLPWLTETQGDGWVSGTLGRDMAANPLQALIMHSLRMFISVHKGACADFGLTLQTTNLKFPVLWQDIVACPNTTVIHPRRACAARVTVLGLCVCESVSLCVCVSPLILALQGPSRLISDTNGSSATRARKVTWRFCLNGGVGEIWR